MRDLINNRCAITKIFTLCSLWPEPPKLVLLTYKYYNVMTDEELFKVNRVFVDIFYYAVAVLWNIITL